MARGEISLSAGFGRLYNGAVTKVRDDSLDVFRGATVAAMILVNNPGTWAHLYAPLAHADWHGWTITDLVFPFFLFAVGNALALTTSASGAESSAEFLGRWLRRTLLIFGIGLLLNAWPRVLWGDIDSLRVMGVLQRIALCWAIAALVIRVGGARAALPTAIVLLIGYGLACVLWAHGPDPYSLEGFFGTHLDRAVFGEPHLYRGEGAAFDPEGLGSTPPAVAQVLLGYVVALHWLPQREASGASPKWIGVGVGLVVLGLIGSLVMPINKKIWTSTYVLLTTGFATITLVAMWHLLRHAATPRTTPFSWVRRGFTAFGRNALLIFALSGLIPRTLSLVRMDDPSVAGQTISLLNWIHATLFAPLFADPRLGSLSYAVAMLAL
ncbi:MAG: acyltransferase family protein, partial [Steroidobacteraceae bacterium]